MSSSTQSAARTRISALLDPEALLRSEPVSQPAIPISILRRRKHLRTALSPGYGQIDGNPVYVYSQDASVLKGTMGEMHAKKIVRIYKLAVKTGAPVIGLIDCAGLRLEEATDALNAFGEIYMAQANASGVVPQITGIFGNCGGGMAIVVPSMSRFHLSW
jgi:acetyl-CoA carboxylase carboxyltransferase component